MAYINKVKIGSSNYLIEPTLFAITSGTGSAYTATIDNTFELTTGVAIQLKFHVTNNTGATFNGKPIKYNNANVAANILKENHIFTLVYDGDAWQITNIPTDEKVKQSPYSTETNYEFDILFKKTNDHNEETNGVNFSTVTNKTLTFNPSTGALTADGGFVGNASTATAWTTAQTVYVDLTNDGTSSTLNGGQNQAQVLSVDGILGIGNGGTGISSFTDGQIVYPVTTNNIQTLTGNSNFTYTSSSHLLNLGELSITGGISNSSLSTTGTLTISSGSSKTTTIQSGSTIYLSTQSSSSIIFQINKNEAARFNTSGHFIPYVGSNTTVSTYQLGTTSQHWAKLYVGADNSYGDEYTPIYWNNGVPAPVASIIQKSTFSLTTANSGIDTITSNTSAASRVIQIVVTSGFSYLKSVITWEILNNQIKLTGTVDGTVEGYILYTK